MSLETEDILGTLYLSVADFTDRASMFGVTTALPDDADIVADYLAAASRWIDAKVNKTYSTDDITEQHLWNFVTRRVSVNNPPVTSISSFRIYVGPTTYADMPVSALFYNTQEKWIELAALTAAYNLVSQLLTLGLYQPIVQITYKSSASVPLNVVLATGYVAASLMSQSYLNRQMPPGIKSIKIGSSSQVTRDDSAKIQDMPPIVSLLLAGEQSIGVA